jgi:hypothetical protein
MEWCLKMDVVAVFPFTVIFSSATYSMPRTRHVKRVGVVCAPR